MALVVAPLLLLAACSGEVHIPAGAPATPDIVLVSVDTLRADHLSCQGYTRQTSPFIDGLARQGVRFASARSASPWTLPSHSTIMSGQLPATHKVIEDTLSLDAQTPCLAQVMRQQGYATGGVVSTMYVSSLFDFDRGFDSFEDFGIHSEKRNLSGAVVASDVIEEALDWWEDRPPGRPVFLFLHFYDVHYEYDPPEPYASTFDRPPNGDDVRYRSYRFFKKHLPGAAQLDHQRAQYDEAIRYLDDQLRGMDQVLRAAGRDVRWVLTADHGEEFGERGSWGHAHTLYAEQLHVPLIMSGGGLPSGVVVQGAVGSQDIAPTIAAWAGASADALKADGVDLNAVIRGQTAPPRPFPAETSRFKTSRLGLLEGGLRLEWDLNSGARELFVEGGDPLEEHDVSAQRPADLARMTARIEALLGYPWEARLAGRVSTDGRILKDGRHKHLRVQPGDRFNVVPPDAEVRFEATGAQQGPWKAVGGDRPGADAPLAWHDTGGTQQVELDAQTRAALESLGYLQGEEAER